MLKEACDVPSILLDWVDYLRRLLGILGHHRGRVSRFDTT
jgi:hypothetical protein